MAAIGRRGMLSEERTFGVGQCRQSRARYGHSRGWGHCPKAAVRHKNVRACVAKFVAGGEKITTKIRDK